MSCDVMNLERALSLIEVLSARGSDRESGLLAEGPGYQQVHCLYHRCAPRHLASSIASGPGSTGEGAGLDCPVCGPRSAGVRVRGPRVCGFEVCGCVGPRSAGVR
eukprot:7083118-Pyramimonas_sp.AAC.3